MSTEVDNQEQPEDETVIKEPAAAYITRSTSPIRLPQVQKPFLSFEGGTLVLRQWGTGPRPPQPFRFIKNQWRCEGYHYGTLLNWLNANGVQNRVPRWGNVKLKLHDGREPHDYQQAALAAWDAYGRRGSIVLPTGAGKTYVAIRAMARAQCATLIIAPTIDLMHQWYARLANAFERPIGVYYGGEKIIETLTVTTYHSAGDLIADYGNQFKLIIYDEVHHLPAPSWGETALMAPAPLRLGLTATYPDEAALRGVQWRPSDLIGPIVFEQRIDDLVGKQLADYRTERIRVDLTVEERARYNADYEIYAAFFRSRDLPRTHGGRWYLELMRLSAVDEAARGALLARQRIQQLLAGTAEKLALVGRLLQEHAGQRVLIFTENNSVVYELSRCYLIPALTHETKAAERKTLLEKFRAGEYPAIVTSKVLNEGIDVPEAKIAIVLGGTAGAREYVQRLGRVLRKVGQQEAVLYEVLARKTVDEGRAYRQKKKLRMSKDK